jgi:hypothetical protein
LGDLYVDGRLTLNGVIDENDGYFD